MRFERIVGGEGPPRIVGVRPLPARSRRPEPRRLPELAPETPAPASGARPDAPHVRPASYVAVSLLFSVLVFGFFLVNEHGLLPKAVEKTARETLNLVKPGEVVLILPEGWQARVKAPEPPAPSPATAGPKSP